MRSMAGCSGPPPLRVTSRTGSARSASSCAVAVPIAPAPITSWTSIFDPRSVSNLSNDPRRMYDELVVNIHSDRRAGIGRTRRARPAIASPICHRVFHAFELRTIGQQNVRVQRTDLLAELCHPPSRPNASSCGESTRSPRGHPAIRSTLWTRLARREPPLERWWFARSDRTVDFHAAWVLGGQALQTLGPTQGQCWASHLPVDLAKIPHAGKQRGHHRTVAAGLDETVQGPPVLPGGQSPVLEGELAPEGVAEQSWGAAKLAMDAPGEPLESGQAPDGSKLDESGHCQIDAVGLWVGVPPPGGTSVELRLTGWHGSSVLHEVLLRPSEVGVVRRRHSHEAHSHTSASTSSDACKQRRSIRVRPPLAPETGRGADRVRRKALTAAAGVRRVRQSPLPRR